jgi:hypothetical protein
MASEREQQQSRLNGEYTEQPSEEPWADFQLTLPHNRSPTAIVSFVECTLVELTHEEVGAEYVSTSVAGVKRIQFIAVDDAGQRFQKRYFDDRLGVDVTMLDRTDVRDELIARLSRSPRSGVNAASAGANGDLEHFQLVPVHELR